jgi:[ribosomal protein S5]-alanine N-acetyltransferase
MNILINDNVFDTFPVLETHRLVLREFRLDDAEALFKIRSDKRVLMYMDTHPHYSIADSDAMIRRIIDSFNNKEGLNWVIKEKAAGKMIGYVCYHRLMRECSRAEIGYSLTPVRWGNGYAIEAVKRLVEFGFGEMNLHSIEANVNPDNAASIKLLEKIGFKKEAHFRENYLFNGIFLDSAIYCLIRSDVSLPENQK